MVCHKVVVFNLSLRIIQNTTNLITVQLHMKMMLFCWFAKSKRMTSFSTCCQHILGTNEKGWLFDLANQLMTINNKLILSPFHNVYVFYSFVIVCNIIILVFQFPFFFSIGKGHIISTALKEACKTCKYGIDVEYLY